MATSKAIRSQIASVQSTQKITKAMQMVAASKIRKAQNRMQASMPYALKIRKVIGHVANSHSEFHNPYLTIREQIKRVGVIIVSSDRGLCGGLNTNLFRKLLLENFDSWQKQNIGIDLCLIGKKAVNFFKKTDFNIVACVDKIGPSTGQDIRGAILATLKLFEGEKVDRVFITYNEFINTMEQKPVVQQLLPLVFAEDESKGHYWDYIYEPEADKLLDTLLRRYIESQVYQAVIDNLACEHAARMVAMKNATDNANSLIDELQKVYNKTRQAAITKEITEIVAGAEAV